MFVSQLINLHDACFLLMYNVFFVFLIRKSKLVIPSKSDGPANQSFLVVLLSELHGVKLGNPPNSTLGLNLN